VNGPGPSAAAPEGRKRRLRRLILWGSGLGLLAAASAATLDRLMPFPAERLDAARRGGSALFLDRDGRTLAWLVGSAEEFRLPVPLDRISPWLARATVAAEDRRFFSHPGVDPLAMARAAGQNLSSGRRVSGASTLTMQTVRLLCPRPRTWPAKLTEAGRALQIERAAGKERILETYLNLAPYGGNAVGAEAAARLYFGKGAAELTLAEAAMLAGIPQSPARFNPRRHPEAALERREYVLGRMLELGLASPDEVERARREPVAAIVAEGQRSVGCRTDPCAAWLGARLGRNCGTVRTTINPDVQKLVRAAAGRHAAELRRQGVDGLAVVVIDVQRAELAAMVACSGDSEVNGAIVPRQPGSLLKPFVYARAFDGGRLTPEAAAYDVPGRWANYRPENFDRDFLGPISTARALAESRNLPAVRTLAALGPETLARDLANLGLALPRPAESYGLSLALGTPELRLVDVTNAYAAMARLGVWRPLRVVRGSPDGEARQVFSPGAAYLTLRCLGAPADNGRGAAWKTGTSWNYRDAWAMAVTPDYAIGVWCGRLCGAGHPSLVGAQSALPLALELAGALAAAGWSRPETVGCRRVCALSGAPPSNCCPARVEAEYLGGVSHEAPCRLHRVEGGVVVTVWPPEVAAFMVQGTARPATKETGTLVTPTAPMHIESPCPGAEYVLAPGEQQTLHLAARSPAGPDGLWWFMDGKLLGRAAAGEALAWPMAPGEHEASACDSSGTAAAVRFRVRAGPR